MGEGLIAKPVIMADRAKLVTGAYPGRTADGEITLCESVGMAFDDLAAARLVIDAA